ncbi:MAG: hypothetical protein KGJ86_22745 [Chloroflexota bacterium]|nr:hypothetical protein [Chloroflexota bacterium]
MASWTSFIDLFLRVMSLLVLPLFFWWFNLKFESNHRRLKQAVDEANALTLSGAARLLRRHNGDLTRLKQLVDRLSTQVDLLFAKVELLETELRTEKWGQEMGIEGPGRLDVRGASGAQAAARRSGSPDW